MQKKKLMKLNPNAKTMKVVGQGCQDDCTEKDCQLIGSYPVQNGIGCRTYLYGPGTQYPSPKTTTWF